MPKKIPVIKSEKESVIEVPVEIVEYNPITSDEGHEQVHLKANGHLIANIYGDVIFFRADLAREAGFKVVVFGDAGEAY